MLELLISLASGAIGGNLAGKKVLTNFDQGTLVNSIVGILGGGLGGTILSTLTGGAIDAGNAASIGGILSAVASGGVGGGALLAICWRNQKNVVLEFVTHTRQGWRAFL